MLKKKYKYIILWWWLNWLSTAYILSKKYKWEILIIEKEKILWGLAKSVNKNGDILDNWSHRLQKTYFKEILDFLKEDLKLNIYEVKRKSKLYLKNDFLNYPIRSFDLFKKLNIFKSIFSIIGSLYYKIILKNKDSFENTLLSKVWAYIYVEFYKPYASKVWGINLNKLSTSVVKKRFLLNPLKILKQIFSIKINKFLYIKWGFWKISDKLEKILLKNKVKILKRVQYYQINLEKDFIKIAWEKINYNNLISTIPLNSLLELSLKKKDNSLGYRWLYLIYLYLNKKPLLEWETFYFPQKKFIFGRVSIPKRFDINLQKSNNYTVYCCEVPFWKWKINLENILYNTFLNLKETNLIDDTYIFYKNKSFKKYEENVYPLYKIWWEESFKKVLYKLSKEYKNLYISWRQWFFLHCNVDHSMKIWFDLGKFLLKNNNNLDWIKKVNSYNNFIVRD